MAKSRVKSYRRNGKLVRGHSRKKGRWKDYAIAGAGGAALGGVALAAILATKGKGPSPNMKGVDESLDAFRQNMKRQGEEQGKRAAKQYEAQAKPIVESLDRKLEDFRRASARAQEQPPPVNDVMDRFRTADKARQYRADKAMEEFEGALRRTRSKTPRPTGYQGMSKEKRQKVIRSRRRMLQEQVNQRIGRVAPPGSDYRLSNKKGRRRAKQAAQDAWDNYNILYAWNGQDMANFAQTQVKAHRRNGKLVKGHSRKRKTLRNIAIGAGVIGAGVGGLAIARNAGAIKAGAKRFGNKVYGKLPHQAKANISKTIKASRARNEAVRRGPAGMEEYSRRLGQYNQNIQRRGQMLVMSGKSSNQGQRAIALDEFRKLPYEDRKLFWKLNAANPQPANRQLRETLLKALRDESAGPVGKREDAFNTVRAYTKHFQKGGDRASETMNPKQYRKLLEKARKEGGGRSASEVRAYVRRELGFNRYLNLTEFNRPRRWRKR